MCSQKKSNKGDIICDFCEKKFSRNYTLKRHLKICKFKKKIFPNDNILEQIEKKKQEEIIIKKIMQDNSSILEKLKELSNNTNNRTIINNTYNNNITVIAYNNNPDLSHLTHNDYEMIMDKGIYSVPNLIKAIHFNPKKPENQNIYIPNIKNKYVMTWNGTNWGLSSRDNIINEMYENNSNILINKMEEFIDIGHKIDTRIMKKFKRFVDKKENDKTKDKIKEEIKLLLYNNKNLVEKITT